MLKVLEGHSNRVTSVAFSGDGGRIVSGSRDRSVQVWDASTGKTLKVLEGHTDGITSVAFSSDGRRIVSGSKDNSMRVWDSSTSEMLETLEGHGDEVSSVAFSSDGRSRSPQYIRQKKMDWFGNVTHTGWLLSPERHYLMFVPSIGLLPDYSNILTLPRSRAASVNFTPSTLGHEWHNCYLP
jgi:WD40 repeat protein